MSRIFVIGFGSTLRGDDAFGPEVAARLSERVVRDDVRIETCQGLTPDLALPLSEAQTAIFIDCSAGGAGGAEGSAGVVGELVHRQIGPREDAAKSMVHFLDPEALLAWSARLYGRCPVAHVLTTVGATFAIADGLSPRVAPVVAEAVAAAERLIAAGEASHA